MSIAETDRQAAARTCGIIVAYQPDRSDLRKLLEAVVPQVDHLIIVDNSSTDELSAWLSPEWPGIEYIPLKDNLGIAKAQNIGISRARAHGASYVLLLDQDSIPAPDMVRVLVNAAQKKQAEGVNVACVGPRYDDPRQQNPVPFIQIKNYRIERQTCVANDSVVEVDYLIASGCLIPIAAIQAVGDMQAGLFIDYVDIEWGLRAQQRGFQSFGVCGAVMQHQLGDTPVYFRGRYIPVHSPLRHYYHFRNAIWLYRQSWLRFDWKIVDGFRLLRKFVFYSLMTPPRLQHAGMMALGIIHGLMNRMGKLDHRK